MTEIMDSHPSYLAMVANLHPVEPTFFGKDAPLWLLLVAIADLVGKTGGRQTVVDCYVSPY